MCWLLIVGIMLCAGCAYGADTAFVSVRGSAGVSAEFYSLTSSGATSAVPRRPEAIFRLYSGTHLRFSDVLEIPIQLQYTYRSPFDLQATVATASLPDILFNPLNHFSISPVFGPVRLEIGSVYPRYGSLIADNAQVFGAGSSISVGKLTVSATYGILQRGIQADTATVSPGSFMRTLFACRISSEPEPQFSYGFSFARINDDEHSIPLITDDLTVPIPIVNDSGIAVRDTLLSLTMPDALMPVAQEGIAVGFDIRAPVTKNFTITAEAAGVCFTRDKAAPELTTEVPVLSLLYLMRTSTRLDWAGIVSAGYEQKTWGIEGRVNYVGPGFICLTQPLYQPDRVDVTINPRISMYNGRLNGTATLGWRKQNIADALDVASDQLLIRASLTATVLSELNINASFTNFGLRTTSDFDTLRYEQVSQSLGITPTYTLLTQNHSHQISVSFNRDVYTVQAVLSQPATVTSSVSANALYGLSQTGGLWGMRVVASYVSSSQQAFGVSHYSVSASGNYKLYNGLLHPDVSLVVGSQAVGTLPSELRNTVRMGIRSKLSSSLTGNAQMQITDVNSTNPAGRSFTEIVGSVSLQISF